MTAAETVDTFARWVGGFGLVLALLGLAVSWGNSRTETAVVVAEKVNLHYVEEADVEFRVSNSGVHTLRLLQVWNSELWADGRVRSRPMRVRPGETKDLPAGSEQSRDHVAATYRVTCWAGLHRLSFTAACESSYVPRIW